MVRLESKRDENRIINITPDDLAFSALANIKTTNPLLSDITKQQWLFKSLWDYVLLMELWTKETTASQRFTWFKKLFQDKDEKRLERLFKVTFDSNGEPKINSLTDRIIQVIDEVEFKTENVSGKIKLKDAEKDRYSFLSEINHAVKILPTQLTHNYFILIDDLDLYWTNEESQNALIAALFASIRKISKKPIRILISIREDIFSQLPIQDKDKMRDKICHISWDTNSLKEMIEKRIISIVKKCKVEEIWGDIFPANTCEIMLSHSTRKPRELIRLTSLCIETASNNSHKRVQESDVKEAMVKYSNERLEDLASEKNYIYPGLRKVLNKFYGKKKEFNLEIVKDIATELEIERIEKGDKIPFIWACYFDSSPSQLAEILLGIGFLQIKPNRTAAPEAYDSTRHNSINADTWLAVHPMYHAGLTLLGA